MDQPFIGTIAAVGFNYAPYGWAFCDGRLLPIAQYSALFSLLGTTYGGNGTSTFGLPDLRGRIALGMGAGPGLDNYVIGQNAGTNTVTLTSDQMPAHTHNAALPSNATASGSTPSPSASVGYAVPPPDGSGNPLNFYGPADNVTKLTATLAIAGAGMPHQNIQPSLGVNYIIALQGIFPSRQ
jgi:microcystin-dependent protein